MIGVYVAGVGIGILLAGAAIPIIQQGDVQRWPGKWVALGVMGAACLPMAWWAARNIPRAAGGSIAVLKAHEFRQLAPTFVGYGLFGAGYVGYMTFIIAFCRSKAAAANR